MPSPRGEGRQGHTITMKKANYTKPAVMINVMDARENLLGGSGYDVDGEHKPIKPGTPGSVDAKKWGLSSWDDEETTVGGSHSSIWE